MKLGSSSTSGLRVRTQVARPSADGLVLCGGESNILVVVNDPTAIFELLQYVHRAIGRGIIDDDDFFIGVALR